MHEDFKSKRRKACKISDFKKNQSVNSRLSVETFGFISQFKIFLNTRQQINCFYCLLDDNRSRNEEVV